MILQNKFSTYDTDIFATINTNIFELSNSEKHDHNIQAYRIISDHIRAIIIALNDGIMPYNEGGRGSVLHKLINRCCYYAYKYFNNQTNFISKLSLRLFDYFVEYDKSIANKYNLIIYVIEKEEQKAFQNIQKGITSFENIKNTNKTNLLTLNDINILKGRGVPYDMIELFAKENNYKIEHNYDELKKSKRDEKIARRANKK